MGLLDIVKKVAMGATDEENAKNRERMRELFNQSVEHGDEYKLLYCKAEHFTNAVLVEITVHHNYIVGYKEKEARTIAVLPVDANLEKALEPIFFSKKNESVTEVSMGFCFVGNKEQSFNLEPFSYQPGVNRGSKYTLAIRQSYEEIRSFKDFFKKGF